MSSRVSRAKAPRPRTSPAVCRAWPSCSRRASPRTSPIISEIPGRIEFGKDYKTKRRIVVVPEDACDQPREYLIPKGKHISVQEGDYVQKGDYLMDGSPVPHDILNVMGIEALAQYLINEIQEVYRLQGVKINDKHIEVIVRQMLQKFEISDPGDTTFLAGRAGRSRRVRRREREGGEGGRSSRPGCPGAARHHQGLAADALVHLRGVVPGDHPRPHRRRRSPAGSIISSASRRT
jgi:hypothetical protein